MTSSPTSPPRPAEPPSPAAPGARWPILLVLGLSQLMIVLGNSVMNVALPSAQADLGFSDADRQWTVTVYALAFGSLLLLGGRLSDLLGRKQALLIGLIGFAAASVLGGAAEGFLMLVVARGAQGAFGAVLAPSVLSLLSATFPAGPDRARAFGVFSAIIGSGSAVGLILGGFLTEFVQWRWALFVNCAFAAIAFLGAAVLLLPARDRSRPHLDVPGALLGTLGISGVVVGLGNAEAARWSTPSVWGFAAAGALLLAGFLLLQARRRSPLLPLRIFRDRNRCAAYLSRFLGSIGIFTLTLFLAYFMQENLRLSPLLTGLGFLPMILGIVVTSNTVVPLLMSRIGPRPLVVLCMLTCSAAFWWLSTLGPTSSYTAGVMGPLLLFGLGQGVTTSVATNAGTDGVDARDMGAASAMVNVSQQLGGSVGTALLSSIAGLASAGYLADVTTVHAPGLADLYGYDIAFLTGAGIFAGGALVCGLLVRRAPTADNTPESGGAP